MAIPLKSIAIPSGPISRNAQSLAVCPRLSAPLFCFRGEASENSDIDVMLILDRLSVLLDWCQSAFSRVEKLAQKEYPIRLLRPVGTEAAHALAWKDFTEFESPGLRARG